MFSGSYYFGAVLADYTLLECGLLQCRVKMRVCAVIITHLIRIYYSLNPPVPRTAIVTELGITRRRKIVGVYVLTAVTSYLLNWAERATKQTRKDEKERAE